jgi:hypothetical protein
MPRTCIAAALALLALLAPTASARVIEDGWYHPKAEKPAHYLVQTERITDTGGPAPVRQYDPKTAPHYPVQSADHRATAPTGSLAGTTNATTAAIAQEQSYASQGDAVATLADKQPSTSHAGGSNADVDSPPWAVLIAAVMGAALVAGGLTLTTRRTRARAAA